MLFVDDLHHRRGIATMLMNNIVCGLKLQGFNKITLNSSPYGLPFYKRYGFKPIDTGQKKDGFIYIPMACEPNEIWETTGGSPLAGEDSLTAVLRETKGELGIDLDPQKGVYFTPLPVMGMTGVPG